MMLSLLVAAALAPNMLLACSGATVAMVPETTTGAIVLDNHGNSAIGSASTQSAAAVEFAVQFEIEDGEARMTIPGGSYPVRDLSVTDTRITGRTRYNFLNSSRFEIDRRTGVITTANGFRGVCRAVDRERRAF